MAADGFSKAWGPILDDTLGERGHAAVQAIAQSLYTPPPAWLPEGMPLAPTRQAVEDASLAGGRAGLAILYTYLAQAQSTKAYAETAGQFLEQAVEAVAALPMDASLYSGFTGIAWAVAHLQGRLLRHDEEDANAVIDEALIAYLHRAPWPGEYDLINGLVGIGVYALERLPRPTAVECLERIVERLDETAERNADGIAWFTPPERVLYGDREEFPDGFYNLGVAHGVPGVIAFLAQVYAAGVAHAQVQPLLEGAVAWLFAQQVPPGAGSRFAYGVGPGGQRRGSGSAARHARLAWCYGDPGIAVALLAAARCVGEPAWERQALDIARAAAERSLHWAAGVDTGLCHGAAGLGHIFNRLFQATGEVRFKEAACGWFQRLLAMQRPGTGIAGFAAFLPSPHRQNPWIDEPGILMGAAGIALALLATMTSIEPAWDRMLLVSIPAPLI